MLRGLAVLCCATSVALAPACNSGKCSTGTLRYGDECVVADPFDKTAPVLTIDPGLYTRHVGTVHITSDKAATIYYTLDGNPATTDSASGADEVVIPDLPDNGIVLRTFAIDLAGNQSAEIVRVWVIDQDGPSSPLDFHLNLGADNATRTVTWAMPPDVRPGGVLVARVDGKLGTPPVSGQTYNVGDKLSQDVTVVAVAKPDATGMFSENMAAGPGLVRYVAWAFDDLYNYGPPAGDFAVVPMPTQTAMLSIDQTTGAVTITSAPSLLGLIANATIVSGTMTLNVSLKNTTARPLFAPKLELTNTLPAGVMWTDNTAKIETAQIPYRAYGPALNANQSNSQSWTFTGITGPGTLSLALTFRDDPVLTTTAAYQGPSIVDSATGLEIAEMPGGTPGKEGDNRSTVSAFTPDGNLVVAQREACQIISYNIGSSRELARADLCMQFGHVPWLVADHSGTVVYAVISNSRPKVRYHVAPVDTQLVRLDAATLTEYGPRIDLGMGMTRSMRLSPDDKTLIIATGVTSEGVIVVDTTTFKISTRIKPDFKVQAAAFAPDGKTIAAVGDSFVGIYDLAGNLILKRSLPGTVDTRSPHMMVAFSSARVIWVSRVGELDTLDLLTGDSQTFNYDGTILEVLDGKIYTKMTYSDVSRLDAAGNLELSLPGLATSRRGHWIGRSPF